MNRVFPFEPEAVFSSLVKTGRLLVAEESIAEGSVGERIASFAAIRGGRHDIRTINAGQRFIPHGTVKEQLALVGLDAASISKKAMEEFGFGRK